MALDPNISLGVRPLQIEMPNQLAQYGQLQQIMAAQDAQQMNALKMQEARAAMDERNALRQLNPTAADYESQLFKVNPQLGISYRKEQSAAEASKAQTAASLASAAKSKQELLGQALRDISSRPSDANITAHTEDIQSSPLFSAEEKAKALVTQQTLLSIPFEERKAYLQTQGAKPSDLRPVAVAPGATLVGADNKPVFTAPERADTDLIRNFNAAKAQGFTGTLFDYERKIKEAGRTPAQPSAPVAVIGPDGKPIYVSREQAISQGMQPAANAPALKPLTEGQTIKLRTDVAKDYKAATTALSQIDDLLASATAVKTSPGLSAATGFTGKYLPSFPEGGAAQAETRLANLRGKVTALGKATAAMSGAIGSIANQEWKILADQIAVLDETKGKGPLLDQIALLEEQAQGAAARIRDTYEKTRAEDFERFPQFRDLPAPKAPAGTPAAGTGGFKYLGKEGG